MADLREWPKQCLTAGERLLAWVCFGVLRLVHYISQLVPKLQLSRKFWLCGDIDGRTWAPAVVINDRQFNKSMSLPSILEVQVDGLEETVHPEELAPVARLFPDCPKFNVNVAFSCGRAHLIHPGVYNNPSSPWFNVFVGYYQIDVPTSLWDHPFGYRSDAANGFTLDEDELTRLGRADWNYFSNYMYGVPLERLDAVGQGPVTLTRLGRTPVGSHTWDRIRVSDVSVASAYVSHLDVNLENTYKFLNNIWRAAFGRPYRSDRPEESFFPTSLSAELLVCWALDESDDRDLGGPVYRTYVFGGTVNEWWARQPDPDVDRREHNRQFLALQMKTLETLIRDEFPSLGFPVAAAVPAEHPAIAWAEPAA